MPLPPYFPSLSLLMISLLSCSWLPLPPCLPSLSPFMISLLGCSWLPLCLPSLSPFMISLLGCSWLPLCLRSLSPFMISLQGLLLAAAATLSPKLVSLHDFPFGLLLAAAAALSPFMVSLLGCSWLLLAPCLPACFPEMLSGVYAGVISFSSLPAFPSPFCWSPPLFNSSPSSFDLANSQRCGHIFLKPSSRTWGRHLY